MYSKILKIIGIAAGTVLLMGGVVLFEDLGAKELVQTKINGLMENKNTLELQKTTLLNKVDELSGNVETLISQKELLLSEIEKLKSSENMNNQEIIKLEKLTEQLQINIDLLVDERNNLRNEIKVLEENKVLLQKELEEQRVETEKANTYIKELYDYINTINVQKVPELGTLPKYEIGSLESQLPSDNEVATDYEVIWDINSNNPNFIGFSYVNLGFQITKQDNKDVVWFFDDRDIKDDINVVFEYIGIDDKTYTVKLEHKVYNILDIEPKKYNRIIINYSDGSKRVIGIVNDRKNNRII